MYRGMPAKSVTQITAEECAAQRAEHEASLRTEYSGTTHLSRCRAAANDLVEYARRGDMALAGEARRTLDTLCWSPDGYPQQVQDILRAGGVL